MCGYSGQFRWDQIPINQNLIKKMTSTLVHRGPDDDGYYITTNDQINIGLGFRRLSIIDLSGGHQPMPSADKRFWIVFNGEIYNFQEIRADLEGRGRKFISNSDTEVILHLYELYGKNCVKYLRGMFSFAIWDSVKKSVLLARDRVGKKPLFYCQKEHSISFASEMKALLESEEVKRDVDLGAIPLYFGYQFIPSPKTIFKEITRLPPAHVLTCDAQGHIIVEKYWTLSRKPGLVKDVQQISEGLLHQLREATKIRMISDVPLGAFLSGGIDSSAVVGMMAEESGKPVKTFSIGFDNSKFSELSYARIVAKHFKTDHHEFIVKPQMAEILPKLAWHYDQPFADPSALPSYYVANETRKHVTVALNGDGGDEHFGGYMRYQADRIFHAVSSVPKPVRSVIAQLIKRAPLSVQNTHFLRRIFKAGGLLNSTPHEFNFKLFCYFDREAQNELFDEPLLSLSKKRNVYDYFSSLYSKSDSEDFIDQILTSDAYGYLPDCLLVKMDIASMANSLEARSPLLDHKLIEYAAQIPSRLKVKMRGGKWIFKEALKDFLPEKILKRRKMGFGIPLADWFQGPLKDYLRDTLLDQKARSRGYFKMHKVEQLIDEHQRSERDHGYKLWALLMFELWNKVYIDGSYQSNPTAGNLS